MDEQYAFDGRHTSSWFAISHLRISLPPKQYCKSETYYRRMHKPNTVSKTELLNAYVAVFFFLLQVTAGIILVRKGLKVVTDTGLYIKLLSEISSVLKCYKMSHSIVRVECIKTEFTIRTNDFSPAFVLEDSKRNNNTLCHPCVHFQLEPLCTIQIFI